MLKYMRMGNKRTKLIWWILTVVVVGSFLGGFIFMFGMGAGGDLSARASGAVGTVDGEQITRAEYLAAVDQQRQIYRQQYGGDPVDRDIRYVEVQAWRALVTEKLLERHAETYKLEPSDREVVLSLQTSPPQELAAAPDFQTDGKFDPAKYTQAIRNPNINWAPFEEHIRRQLPTRKLQERLLASLKLSAPEVRDAFRNRFEQITATIVQVPPQVGGEMPPPSSADLERVYREFKGRFNAPARTQLEILQVPIRFRDEDAKAAMDMAQGLAERARRGEDFAALARDFSEGPGVHQGGVINRPIPVEEFGPDVGKQMAVIAPGEITNPRLEGGRVVFFKLLERLPDPTSGVPSVRVAQIIVKVRPEATGLQAQADEVQRIRERAAARGVGLGKAASEKGLATTLSGYFDLSNPSPALMDAPEAIDWGMLAKEGEVSPVFRSDDSFTIVQVANQRPAGPATQQDVAEPLRQLADIQARVRVNQPAADRVAQALAGGASLEDAAKAGGATLFTVGGVTRAAAQDPRLNSAPEVVGAAFAVPIGKVVGPIESLTGWYFVRVDRKLPAEPQAFEQLKGQITNEILNQRQRAFFAAWITEERQRAKIRDLRNTP
ncbi:MAG TPA: SurA N-terminal domain-containing protein [Candidatus Limnocylindria bacterium]|nr:SurA N-terminal domain-containing protein [Candidatus Limnocylindria bacterium]